jgi:hypothetical protein
MVDGMTDVDCDDDRWDEELELDLERHRLRLMANPVCGTPDHPGCPGCEDMNDEYD